MNNSKTKINSLIKRKNLIFELRKAGIFGVNPEAIKEIENLIERDLIDLVEKLKQEMIIKGRKILQKEDIKSVLEKSNSRKKIYSNWEI